MSDAAFNDWGWRIPFPISVILVLLSGYIRLKLEESPLYARLKEEGKSSTNPIKDTYTSGQLGLDGDRLCSARRRPRGSSGILVSSMR